MGIFRKATLNIPLKAQSHSILLGRNGKSNYNYVCKCFFFWNIEQ